MSSSTAINFESLEAQVRAEADRKVTVLREIVTAHATLTHQRDAFLAADAERVRQLGALVSEARTAGFDAKTLKPFEVEHLTSSRTGSKTGGSRRRRTNKKDAADQSTVATAGVSAESHSAGNEQSRAAFDAGDHDALSA
ncbi:MULTISPECIES: hypothetical protein [Actinomycetes]|uniref:hypothetical protein n=1 Tax=Actinomycetes TaxID=1760 RepID=UPI00068ECE38|nr:MULTISPECIES: hypothetical protein [Actinomycetes]